jgi:hypothetical protein
VLTTGLFVVCTPPAYAGGSLSEGAIAEGAPPGKVPAGGAQPPIPPQIAEFFETKIRPVLAESCFSCHGPKKQQANLRLDSREALLKGSENGPVIVSGQPDKSLLIHALRQQGELRMPPRSKLAEPVIADFAEWIKLGVPWPASKDPIASKTLEASAGKNHWSFQPVRNPPIPVVKSNAWPQTPVDAFILSKLEAKGLTPNPAADRRTLLRRLKFDLLGLPPTFEEVAAFEADKSADAYSKLVDRYLASPQYGERWARHWLDVARYADTKGYVFEEERKYAFSYTYRDWVIRAFNEDLPYDQFILQQIAADLLVAQGAAEPRAQAAMGFLTLGRRFLNNTADIIDDRIDVVSRGLQGLTVGCARCHDHKYDPIPTKDYYSLYGVFASSREPKELPLLGESNQSPETLEYEKKLSALKADVKNYEETNKKELSEKNRKFADGLRALQKKVDAFQASSPFAPPRAMVLVDAAKPENPRVFLRGNPSNPGPQVPRQFLEVLAGPQRRPFSQGSGRLELAQAIAGKDNPLTARVMVNRLWQHHFGIGLVATASNFGLRGEFPSHPELLDYLAWRFMEEGWSIKKLHRLIVLSSVYQTTSETTPAAQNVDPENRLLAHFNRRRLEWEALRDSLLQVSGKLDLKMGGPAVDINKAPFSGRRTVYGFIDRQNLPDVFRTFDLASPDASTAQRYQTTVPQQALFLLNSPFLLEQSKRLLERPELAGTTDQAGKIQKLYRLIYARNPEADEVKLGERFLANTGADQGVGLSSWQRYGQVLLLANEFAFVD